MVRVLTSVDSAPQHWEYTERYVSHYCFHVFKEAKWETHGSADLGKPRPLWDGLSCSSLTQNVAFPFLQEQQATVKEHSYVSPPLSERKHSGPGSSRVPYSSFSMAKWETANSSLSLLLVSQQSFVSPRLPQENRTSGGSNCSPFDLGSNTCWLSDLGHISLTTVKLQFLIGKMEMLGNCSIVSAVYDNYHSHDRCWLSLRVSSAVRAPVSTCSSMKESSLIILNQSSLFLPEQTGNF